MRVHSSMGCRPPGKRLRLPPPTRPAAGAASTAAFASFVFARLPPIDTPCAGAQGAAPCACTSHRYACFGLHACERVACALFSRWLWPAQSLAVPSARRRAICCVSLPLRPLELGGLLNWVRWSGLESTAVSQALDFRCIAQIRLTWLGLHPESAAVRSIVWPAPRRTMMR